MGTAIRRRVIRSALSALRPRHALAPLSNTEASAEALAIGVQNASDPVVDIVQDAVQPENVDPRLLEPSLDLCDTSAVEDAAQLSRGVLFWPYQHPGDIEDRISAARFLIDLLRSRADIRLRFPRALTGGARSAFVEWLAGDGRASLALSETALNHIGSALKNDISKPLRQYLLFRDDVRAFYPLGFTPAGRRGMFYWVANEALREGGPDGAKAFGAESMWWLFLTCAEDPEGELVQTYQFMPDWQRAHPYGLTVFGTRPFCSLAGRALRHFDRTPLARTRTLAGVVESRRRSSSCL